MSLCLIVSSISFSSVSVSNFVLNVEMALRTPMKKTHFGSRDLLANGGGCPVEVRFYSLREWPSICFCHHQGFLSLTTT